MLALRVWATTYVHWFARLLAKLSLGRSSTAARDWALQREARRIKAPTILWEEDEDPQESYAPEAEPAPTLRAPLKAAE